jgi:parallel beta-helix repeat protein
MLDSANYNTGTVNITKSVNILAVPGVVGSVVALGGPAISIATAAVDVTLRNLVIAPLMGGGGTLGVNMTNGASLTIDGCLLANLPQSAIRVSAAARLRVTDSTIRDNGGIGIWLDNGASAVVTRTTISGNNDYGVLVHGSVPSTLTTADVSGSTLDGNSVGLLAHAENATGNVKASVRGSRIHLNTYGLAAVSSAGGLALLAASNNIVTNSSTSGIRSDGTGAKVWADRNTVSANPTGLEQANSGLFESAGNNPVRNNNLNKSGTISVVGTE